MYLDHETLCLDSTFLTMYSLIAYFSHLRFIKFILIFCLIHLELLIYIALILVQNLTSSCLLQLMRSQNLSMNPMTLTSSLLKKCKFALLPTITNLINLSLALGVFPDQFKSCSVHPLLKKPNCDKDDLSNYRPISHLSFLSKLTERVVKNRLTNFISNNNLLNSSQSAYTKYHSTETTLLAVLDHIIRAISQQQITCLCLLDLSAAAFDTVDHSILIERLSSWFGISGTALNWIISCLSSRSFHVKIKNFQSSVFSSFMVFLGGLFLVHFYSLFIITP